MEKTEGNAEFDGLGVNAAAGGEIETESLKEGAEGENNVSEPGNEEAPKPVKRIVRRVKPKKKRSVVGELIKIVLGGLFAFPLAHYIVWGIYLGTGKPAPGGLYPIPTPFIQQSYRYAKDFPQIPEACWKYVLLGFDPARDLAPEPSKTEIAKNEVPATPSTTDENAETVAGEVAFGENEEFGGFEMDESEVAQTAAEYVKFRSDNLPEYDAAEVALEFDPANIEAFQTAMLKVSFLKKGEDGKKLEDQARSKMKSSVKGKKADALNQTVLPWLTKENHGKGIMITGKVKKVVDRGDFKITIVKVDGTNKDVKLISQKSLKKAKGKRYVFTGVIFDPDQDEKIESKKKDEVLIWRGLFKSLPAKKVKKAKKDKDATLKTAPAVDATPEAAPAAEANLEAAPAAEANSESAPAAEANPETVPAAEANPETAPAEEANLEAAPAEEANSESAPAAEANPESAPAAEANPETVSAEEANLEAAPAEEANLEAAPVEEATPEAAPVEGANAE